MKKQLTKKHYIIIAAVVVVLLLAWCFCCCGFKVATVNAQMIVSRSVAIRNLQHEQQLQYEELQKWLQESDNALKKQTNAAKKKEMMNQFQLELQQKQIAMQQEYAAKTQKIEDDIIAVVEKVAHRKGYKVVLDKNSVIAGGKDITEDVITKLEEVEAEMVKNDSASEEVPAAEEKTAETPENEETPAE